MMKPLLAIETSCDDTCCAVVAGDGLVLSSIVSSQIEIHAPYGGIVPELASRHHLMNLPCVVDEALTGAGVAMEQVGAVASTAGPGLLGSLLVGLSYGKAAASALGVPFYAVNHIEAHLRSPWIERHDFKYPVLALVASGGHSHLFFCKSEDERLLVSATRDDAAGEALDKVAKHIGLPYPGGPWIDRLARRGDARAVSLPLPRFTSGELDYSFSGLKVAALHHLNKLGVPLPLDADAEQWPQWAYDLLASFQKRVVDHLLQRVRGAALELHPAGVVMAGGVACNSLLRERLAKLADELGIAHAFPSPKYCADNAAMVGFVALDRYRAAAPSEIEADSFPSSIWQRMSLKTAKPRRGKGEGAKKKENPCPSC